MTESRVWVGCVACYSQGRSVGDWVDAITADDTTSTLEWRARAHADLARLVPEDPWDGVSRHEEWWVMDHEGLPLNGECSPFQAQELAEFCEQVDNCGVPLDAVLGYAQCTGDDLVAVDLEVCEAAYLGQWDSIADYAEDHARESGLIPSGIVSWPLDCIDWDEAAGQLFHDLYDVTAPAGGIYVFDTV
ncbi:antirestriction protein ArdA [Kribbella deserti]|uniref:Antirestriction protein ArdA n=1 Tax=Kribbella deserti TaxID=1926257 RepID=A0ABV6QDX2_9ACTN